MRLQRWQKALLLFIFYYALLYIGAAIIMYIEAKGLEKKTAENIRPDEQLKNILAKDYNITMNETNANKILEISYKLFAESKKRNNSRWKTVISKETLFAWRHFTHVTITTVGFGNIVPETNGGKIFVIIYAIIGIPINIALIAMIGFILSDGCRHIIRIIEKRFFGIMHVNKLEHKTLFLLSLICLGWFGIGVKIGQMTMRWSWVESFYSAFVAFSTIGYGDYVISGESMKDLGELLSWYTLIGLATVTGIFDAISAIFNSTVPIANTKVSCEGQIAAEIQGTQASM